MSVPVVYLTAAVAVALGGAAPPKVSLTGQKSARFNVVAVATAPARVKGYFEALIEIEQIVRASADEAFAAYNVHLLAQLYDPVTGFSTKADLLDERSVRATADTAEATARLTLDAQVNNVTTGLPATHARLVQEEIARATADTAEASARQTLEATVFNPSTGLPATLARLQTEEITRASADTAEAALRTTLSAQVNNPTTGLPATLARLITEETTRSNADSAIATRTTTLEATARAADDFNARLTYVFSWATAAGFTTAGTTGISTAAGEYIILTQNVLNGVLQIRSPVINPAIAGSEMPRLRLKVRRDVGTLNQVRVYYTTNPVTHGEDVGFYLDLFPASTDVAIGAWVVLEFNTLVVPNQPSNGFDWLNHAISFFRVDFYGSTTLQMSVAWVAAGTIAPPAYQARVTVEESARAGADGALAARATTLEAQMNGESGSFINSRIATEETTRSNFDSASAGILTTLTAQMAGTSGSFLNSRIATEETARVNGDSALSTRTSVVEAASRANDAFNARVMWNFQATNLNGWTNVFNTALSNGFFDLVRLTQLSPTGGFGIQSPAFSTPAITAQHVKIKVRRVQGTLSFITLYYSNSAHGPDGTKYGQITPSASEAPLGEFAVLDLDMIVVPNQPSIGYEYVNSGSITGLRFDFAGSANLILDVQWIGVGTNAPPDYEARVTTEQTARVAADTAEALLRQAVAVTANGISANGAMSLFTSAGPAGYVAQYTLALSANGQPAGLRVRAKNDGTSDMVLAAATGYLEHPSVAGGVPQLLWTVQDGRFVFGIPVTVLNGDLGFASVDTGKLGSHSVNPPLAASILGGDAIIATVYQAYLATSLFCSPEYMIRLDLAGAIHSRADADQLGADIQLRIRDDFGVISERLVTRSTGTFQSTNAINEFVDLTGYNGVRNFFVDIKKSGGLDTHLLIAGAKLLPSIRFR